MENNIGRVGSALWSCDQHIDHGGFSPQQNTLLMEEDNHQLVVYESVP